MSTPAQIEVALERDRISFNWANVCNVRVARKGWYAIWVLYLNPGYLTCIYVGASHDDIRDRLLRHLRNSDNACVKSMVNDPTTTLFFSYAEKQPLDNLLGIEAELITSMKPKCNDEPDPRIRSVRTR